MTSSGIRFGRRPALLLLGGAALLPLHQAHAAGSVRFRMMRNGSQIGTHSITVRPNGDQTDVAVDIEVHVTLAGFTVFRYVHATQESWRDGRLQTFRSHQDRNGRVVDMNAHQDGSSLLVNGKAGPQRLSPDAAALTWWNPAILSKPLFDAADGQSLTNRPQRLADDRGRQHWKLVGDDDGEAWYDSAGTLVNFTTTGDDGSTVVYERI